MTLRTLVKRVVFGGAHLRESATLALASPQNEVLIHLVGLGAPLDVTRSTAICGLDPLLIGIAVPKTSLGGSGSARLEFSQARSHKLLATIDLEYDRLLCSDIPLALFRARTGRRNFPNAVQRWASNTWLDLRRAGTPSPHSADVKPAERDAVFAFYMCPRPLWMVSTVHEGRANLFPMDLCGSIEPGWATFALNTDKAVADLIRNSGRLVVAGVPAGKQEAAYGCGRHHRLASIDLAALPFSTFDSPEFAFPVPDFSSDVTEYVIECAHVLGSHTLFVAREVRRTIFRSLPQLHLTMATYVALRARAGAAQPFRTPTQTLTSPM